MYSPDSQAPQKRKRNYPQCEGEHGVVPPVLPEPGPVAPEERDDVAFDEEAEEHEDCYDDGGCAASEMDISLNGDGK